MPLQKNIVTYTLSNAAQGSIIQNATQVSALPKEQESADVYAEG
jgi:hypothetical protein